MTLTSAGFATLAGLAGDVDSQVAFTRLANGSGVTTPAVGDTDMETENTTNGAERSVVDTVSRTQTTYANDTLRLVHAWSITGTIVVNEVGVVNNATPGSGEIMAHSATSATRNLSNGDTYTVTYDSQFA